jgi:hypothetical protein
MSIIIALVLTLSALLGLPAQPASAAQTATIEAPIKASEDASLPTYLSYVSTSEDATTCEEDMPCWDCDTMGNLQCGPATAQPEACEEDEPCWDPETMGNGQVGPDADNVEDAFMSYESQTGRPIKLPNLSLEYVGTTTLEPTALTLGQFTIQSSNHDGVWHIMEWTTVTDV